ncbi:MAG: PIN domain-containing protein [Bacteroidetes bacterium]|nr:PIN domain-containing protein [Bacteroidota bacterium]
MKIFIDANILVSVLLKEHGYFISCAKVLSLADRPKHQLFTTSICIAVAFYFAEKSFGKKEAKRRIEVLSKKLNIAVCDKREVEKALTNKKVLDLEDGMEYYAALHSGCNYIVTQDVDDFYFSEIEVLKPDIFLKKHFK